MERRGILKLLALAGVGASSGGAALAQAAGGTDKASGSVAKPIVLYCDLAIDPEREEEMLQAFNTRFRPAAEQFRGRGFIDLKMVKLRTVIQGGPAPAPGINYRFQLTYESEEQRQVWVRSDLHQEVWPLIENTVLNKDYLVLLTDAV